ncbi:MAG: cobalt-zinc-cadmium resistance protein CzcC [Nitrospirae bacterium]|nr:MAG: cobalt-zinc-cadmium resistance protein CzcC [Nitrospirota bacterium]
MRSALMAALLLSAVLSASAALSLTMEQAVTLGLENNMELKAKQAELGKAEAEVIGAAEIPNPSFQYGYESLKNREYEIDRSETFTVSQSIDFLWKRGKRVEAAEKSREARDLLLRHETSGVAVQIRQTYGKVLLLEENSRQLSELAASFSEVVRIVQARVAEGDAAEGELLKLGVERGKLQRTVAAAKAEALSERRKLGLLIVRDINEVVLTDSLTFTPLRADARQLLEQSWEHRSDIVGQLRLTEAAAAAVSAAKRDGLPAIAVEAGYKRQSGGFSGMIFGVSVPLPFWNQNRSAIAKAEAGREQQHHAAQLARKTAQIEVLTQFDKAAGLSERVGEMLRQLESAQTVSQTVSRGARLAYEEGASTLIELLDAVRFEKDLVMEYNSSLHEYRSTVFDLERTAGSVLTVREENRQ